jgi:hypothetical protein
MSTTKTEFIRSDYLQVYTDSIRTRHGSTLCVFDTKHHKCQSRIKPTTKYIPTNRKVADSIPAGVGNFH